jgi:hypothetical protein
MLRVVAIIYYDTLYIQNALCCIVFFNRTFRSFNSNGLTLSANRAQSNPQRKGRTTSQIVMKASNFLGVPNAQVNSYIQQLSFYQNRIARGHGVALPEMPTFTFPNECDTKHDSLIHMIDEELLQWRARRIEGDSRSLGTAHSTASHYTEESQQSRRSPVREGELQKSDLMARKYCALMLEDSIGNMVRRTEKGDPLSVKTYGWRLVSSKQVANPHLVIPFSEIKKQSNINECTLVYIGIGDDGVDAIFKGANKGMTNQFSEASSPHPQEALGYSAWRCDESKITADAVIHDARICVCKDKTKQVLVCATARDGQGTEMIVPVRVETFVWRPEGIEEVNAYAEFASQVVCSNGKVE